MEIIEKLSAFILAAISAISILSVMKYRVDRNEKDDEKNGKKLDGLVSDVNALLAELKGFTREQAVVNQFTASTISSIAKKLEELERTVSERASLVELVRELLKKLEKVNIEP